MRVWGQTALPAGLLELGTRPGSRGLEFGARRLTVLGFRGVLGYLAHRKPANP